MAFTPRTAFYSRLSIRNIAIGVQIIAVTLFITSPFSPAFGQNVNGNENNDYADIRKPVFAGQFYPADSRRLSDVIDSLFSEASEQRRDGNIRGIVVPHAAYAYSGSVAASVYKAVAGRPYDAVIILAPSHRELFDGAAIYPGSGLETPLGIIPIDKNTARELAQADELIDFSTKGYSEEHSLEVQLPFIQSALPNTPVVPLMIGRQNYGAAYELSRTLSSVLRGKNVLIAASTDLSHYHAYDDAVRLDGMIIDALSGFDHFLLSLRLFRGEWEACGPGPMVSMLAAAQELGSQSVHIVKYMNSGDITGDKRSVVGYAGAIITDEKDKSMNYSPAERAQLLRIARRAVERKVRDREPEKLDDLNDNFMMKMGVFVTLKINDVLRGCIGNIFAVEPLAEGVQKCAVNAAVKDSRFMPVSKKELAFLEYEISILSPLRPIRDPDRIEVGKHGIFMIHGSNTGILLPQVAVENGWDREEFLENICLKAGLPKETWRDPYTFLFTFTAEVFGESPRQ